MSEDEHDMSIESLKHVSPMKKDYTTYDQKSVLSS